jgi:hypothetical protein
MSSFERFTLTCVFATYLAATLYVAIYLTVLDRRRGLPVWRVVAGNALFALAWPVAMLAGFAVYGLKFFGMPEEDDEETDLPC